MGYLLRKRITTQIDAVKVRWREGQVDTAKAYISARIAEQPLDKAHTKR